MSFYVIDNTTKEPIDGLTVTAEPLDNHNSFYYVFPVQEAGQKTYPGWYFIPSIYAPEDDVPPGIHHIIIKGEANGKSYLHESNTSAIPMKGRYGETVNISPEE